MDYTALSFPRLRSAIDLARKGLFIFPLRSGSKKPLSDESWKEIMTRDSDIIKSWFIKNPTMNYGVCPGDHFAVIDLDIGDDKDGIEAFTDLECDEELDNWVTSETFTVTSPSGGKHLYLAVDNAIGNAHNFPPKVGIDIRGAAGYVVGPNCELDIKLEENDYGGTYDLESDCDIKLAPEWITARFKKQGEKDKYRDVPVMDVDLPINLEIAEDYLQRIAPAIEGENGNDHTFKVLCQIRDYGVSLETGLDLIMEKDGWNDKCDPPWTRSELEIVAENVYRYGQNRTGSKGSILDIFDNIHDKIMKESAHKHLNNTAPISDTFADLRAMTFKGPEIAQRDTRREYIIPEWVLAHGYTIMLARRACGKTTIMMDMAMRVATDMDWHGLPIKEGLVAIYLCGEDDLGLTEQYKAWVQMHEVEPELDRLIIMAGIVDILSAKDTEKWTRYLMGQLNGRRAILFLDTWQRASAAGNQNDDGDVQIAVQHVEAMASSLNGPAIVACHPPKNDENASTVLGSSLMENASAGILTVRDIANGKEIRVTRIKGKGYGNYRVMRFEEMYLDEIDEFGQERTGIVPVKIAGTELGGAIEEDDENTENRMMLLAHLIKDLDLLRKSTRPDTKAYTISVIAKVLESFANNVYDNERQKELGQKAIRQLKEAGMSGFSCNNIRKLLTKAFDSDPRGYDFGDGYCLRTKKDGKAKRFYIEKGI